MLYLPPAILLKHSPAAGNAIRVKATAVEKRKIKIIRLERLFSN